MSGKSESFIVLFGSAAAGAPAPRDLDVVVGGGYSVADAELAAREWWQSTRRGLPLALVGLPVDPPPVEVHRQQGSRICLLRPRGAEVMATALRGGVEIEWQDVDSLPAALRLAADGHADAAREMTGRLLDCNGRFPLSMAYYDVGSPDGRGTYAGDGPVALERALARTGDVAIDELLPSTAASEVVELLTTIRANPGVWSRSRWRKDKEPPLMAGLRAHWQGGTPLGCRGWVGTRDVVFNYAPAISVRLVREIIETAAQGRR